MTKRRKLRWSTEISLERSFYLELQDHGLPDQGLVNQQLLKMSRETGIELVATNDVHYTYAKDEKRMISFCVSRQGKAGG